MKQPSKSKSAHSAKRFDNVRRANLFWTDPKNLRIVGVDEDVSGPDYKDHDLQPKDPTRYKHLDQIMVASMKAHGVKAPVIARKIKNTDLYMVCEGRRRVLHARAADVEVPFIAEVGDTLDALETTVLGNSFRVEDSLLSKAQMAGQLLARGRDVAQVAVLFGVAPNTVRTWKSLLQADPKVQKAVHAGTLSESAAATIAALPGDKQVEALTSALEAAQDDGGKVTHQRARAAANTAAGREENVGLRSRKQMKRLREMCEGDEGENVRERAFLDGVKAALTVVLGDGRAEKFEGVDLNRLVKKVVKGKK